MAEPGGSVRPNDDGPLWQQPRVLIAMGVTAVVLLVAGIAVSLRGGGGEQIATDTAGSGTTTVPATTTLPPAP